MAKYTDYLPGGPKYKGPEEAPIEEEVKQAAEQQEDREESTPEVDWQKRYKDLEVAYSRQGQQIGEYRQLVDNYLSTDSTPDEANGNQEVSPITQDDIFDNPDEAVKRAVDSHPAIKRAQELEKELEQTRQEAILSEFKSKHPGFEDTVKSPEFANWVSDDPTRVELAVRADGYDMIAADALLTLWEAQNAPKQEQSNVDDAILESGTGGDPAPEARYSRSEMFDMMVRAKQGDIEADTYVRQHAAAYRQALTAGNVRD